jgi:integrase
MPKIDGTGLVRTATGWSATYRDPRTKRQVQEASPDGTKRGAFELRRKRLAEIAAGTWVHPRERSGHAGETVAEWFDRWMDQRHRLPKPPKTLGDDEARMREHVLPELGAVALEALTDRHLVTWIAGLRRRVSPTTGKVLARNTQANIWGTLSKCLADAERDMKRRGIAWINPVDMLDPSEKPRRVKRKRSYYRRNELEALIGDPKIPHDRRALWALIGLCGFRHDEAAELRWGDIDRSATVMPRITLARQVGPAPLKEDRHDQGLTRTIPLHPTLDTILESWRASGWPEYFGRHPTDEDLVVPAERGPEYNRPKRSTLKQIRRDAELVGVTPRTVHELRSSFLTLCSEDSPELEAIVKLMTHTPKGDASDHYMITRWRAKCRAMQAFDVRLDRRGQVAGSIPQALAAGCGAGRGENTPRKMAERTGLEPAASGVTGRRYNQLNYRSRFSCHRAGPRSLAKGAVI